VSNYTKSTNFSAKDTLPLNDPAKIIKGTEFDAEFNAIVTAISSKADSANPVFTGTPVAPTASPGTNTTQLATTAFVTSAAQSLYPVGSIYINASNSTNPGTLLGFGTWTAFGAGRVPVGFDASDALFDTAEETGGSKDAIVVSHTHTATVTDPGHNHTLSGREHALGTGNANEFSDTSAAETYSNNTSVKTATTGITVSNSTTGSSGTNANLQPYITVYMWKRVS
jgi:hypothetical protein